MLVPACLLACHLAQPPGVSAGAICKVHLRALCCRAQLSHHQAMPLQLCMSSWVLTLTTNVASCSRSGEPPGPKLGHHLGLDVCCCPALRDHHGTPSKYHEPINAYITISLRAVHAMPLCTSFSPSAARKKAVTSVCSPRRACQVCSALKGHTLKYQCFRLRCTPTCKLNPKPHMQGIRPASSSADCACAHAGVLPAPLRVLRLPVRQHPGACVVLQKHNGPPGLQDCLHRRRLLHRLPAALLR